ncbi:MAG: heparan-alpha-glucosaminide N-acetyltransferase [Bacilli bacterium]|nr:heparan-alpha-glucosaminide N-acetyltransferase [Bacilli bacterium]MDD4547297.1 heparan-alpha-glucosaminide N-acetyltransferase [Bacilli bacterium]
MENKRIFEIDILKIIAVALMVIFHLVYDLNEFLGLNVIYESGFWYFIGRISAITFIIISGINSGFSKDILKKGIMTFFVGMLISLITFFVFKGQFVRFGILHFLGVCMILYPILKKIDKWMLLMFTLIILFGINTSLYDIKIFIFFDNVLGKASVDYYPLFPYIGLYILGIFLYKVFYYKKLSILNLYTENKLIIFTSKQSLLIYLIHQPLILFIMYIINFFL